MAVKLSAIIPPVQLSAVAIVQERWSNALMSSFAAAWQDVSPVVGLPFTMF